MPIPHVLYNILSFAIAATSAIALSPLCFRVAVRIGAVDIPADGRRMHTRPIPRAGGLAVFAAFLLPAAIFAQNEMTYIPLLIGGLVIVATGLIDDVYRMNPWQKLGLQTLSAILAVSSFPEVPFGGGLASITAVLWIVILTNAFNLIDGLDGLCVRVAVSSAFGLFFLGDSPMALAFAGAMVGFLPFNLRPARMFLGDTGSLFAGFSLGVISLDTLDSVANLLPLLFIFALPLADTAFAFFRRTLNGKSPFSPDRGHFHHRLIDRGFSHREASLLLSLLALAFSSIGVSLGS